MSFLVMLSVALLNAIVISVEFLLLCLVSFVLNAVLLSVVMLNVIIERRNTECHIILCYAEFR
jgi:hypothetical protein